MNPLNTIVIAISGLLMLSLVSNLLTELMNTKKSVSDELDLINLLNIHSHGVLLKADFNASYKPEKNGTLIINSNNINLNNATKKNPGIKTINCDYDTLIISRGEINCLKH